jgi:hypothetical protein
LISIAQGVGPVCMKKVRQLLQDMRDRFLRGEAQPGYQNAYAMSPEELRSTAEAACREAYLERLRNRRPTREPVTVGVDSRTRDIINEATTVEWIDRDHAHVESEGGGRYLVTEQSCTCPDFVHRRSRNPQLAQEGCRHMQALRIASEQVAENRRMARRSRQAAPVTVADSHETNRPTFAQIDWTVEAEREEVLNTWRERRAFDGVFISRDDAAWAAMQGQASQEWEYRYENVLGARATALESRLKCSFQIWNSAMRPCRNCTGRA